MREEREIGDPGKIFKPLSPDRSSSPEVISSKFRMMYFKREDSSVVAIPAWGLI